MKNIVLHLLLACVLVYSSYKASAQCMLKPIGLDERVSASGIVVEGIVTSSKSLWDDKKQNIYTIYSLEVLSVFKGDVSDKTLYIVAQGGIVDNQMERVTNALEVGTGKAGVFMLTTSKKPVTTGYSLYETYSGPQGYLRYEKETKKAIGVFDEYASVEKSLYPLLEKKCGRERKTIKKLSWKSIAASSDDDHHDEMHSISSNKMPSLSSGAVISSFSPGTVQAGRSVVLTINGSGFGATQGTAYVQFPDANYGGTQYTTPQAHQYISWSDTKIEVEVPTAAGTGAFRISDGTTTKTAASSLTVEYNITNVTYTDAGVTKAYFPKMTNDNAAGGYTYQLYTAFDANTNAKTDFTNVITQWRCATGVNWAIGATTTTNTNASDGINIVRFDIGSELSAGVLGQAQSRYTGCGISGTFYWYLAEVDVVFDDGANFSYGSSTPSALQYDFYTVALHEMGHAHQLGHIIDNTKVMNYSIGTATQRRNISTAEDDAAAYVMTQSTGTANCSSLIMWPYSCTAPTVTLTASSTSIAENGTSTITATLSGIYTSAVTVNLALTGTATTTNDYTLATSITVPAGSLSASITLSSVNDVLDETNETVIINISSVTNGTESGTQVQTVTITDDDAAPTVTLSASSSSISETSGSATITATLSAASGQAVTVTLALTGTATVTTDYTLSTTITIAAGNTTGTATLASVGDVMDEADETVIIDISAVTNGSENGTQQQTVTITDDDAAPTVTLTTAATSFTETAGSTTVTATLSAASSQSVTVTLALTGTATVTTDYTLSTTITINAGNTTGTATLASVSDVLDEANETVIIDISAVTNGTENATQQRTVTINDDDAAPTVTLSASSTSISETSGSSTITATLSAVSGQAVTVTLGLTGTATITTDYTLSTTITINAGSTTGTATLASVSDVLDEPNETVIVDITAVTNGTENATQQQTVTINDDDAAPSVTLSASSTSISETSGSSTITATLSAASGQTVTVTLGLTGTATVTADYTLPTTITITAGNTTGTTTLATVGDVLDEPNETVIADITAVTNGTENATQQQTVTINDDDAAPTVTLSTSSSSISETSGSSTITATLSAASGQTVTVTLGLTGTATVTTDYTLPTTITITAGNTTGTATLATVGDLLDEPNETVIIDITAVTNGTENATQQQTVTINDDDAAPSVTLSTSSSSISETSGSATVTATLSAASGQTVTVSLGLTGTATAATDYTLATTITIAAGSTTGTATLASVSDLMDENNETVIVDITAVTNGTENATQQQTVTINDDDAAPSVSIGVGTSSIVETAGSTSVTATLSAISSLDVTVSLSMSGNATYNGDYTLANTITILAGNTSAAITLASVSDLLDEEDELVTIDISAVSNGTENGTQVQSVTIADDDAAPTVSLSLADASINENGGTTSLTLTLSAVSARDINIDVAPSGSATSDVDYNSIPFTITISAGNSSATATINAIDDNIDELDETLVYDIVAINNGTENGTQQSTLTIIDNENTPAITLSASNSVISESGSATLTATASGVSDRDITIALTYSGSATIGNDYNGAVQLIIPAGSSSVSTSLTGITDAIDEADEQMVVEITSVTNAIETGSQAETITITDENTSPEISIAVNNASIGEASGTSVITVSLSEISGQEVSVTLNYGGSATAGSDYTSNTTIVIPAGSSSATITLSSIDDANNEGDETIEIAIASITNGIDITTQTLNIALIDNDLPEFALTGSIGNIASGSSVNMSSVNVGTTETFNFTIHNEGLADLILTNGSKVVLSGADASYFTLNTASLNSTITGNGSSSFSISFTGNCDLADRSVTVTIENNDANEGNFSFVIEVNSEDVEDPTIVCPANISLDSDNPIVVNYTLPTVSDNCTPTLSLVSGGASGSAFAVGTTVVTYEVSDAAGNSTTCSFNVIVSPITSVETFTSASFQLYPNPTEGVLYLELSEAADKLVVYDDKGISVLETTTIATSETFDLSGFAQGIYSVHIFKGDKTLVKKISVLR